MENIFSNTLTNALSREIESAYRKGLTDGYEKGFRDGESKQAILEIRGRDKFLAELKKKRGKEHPPVDLEKLAKEV
jgi:flagellar biosynthesis/type III secretory pathway protein FliH